MDYGRVSKKIWSDEKFKRLSQDGKFVFIYMICSPHNNGIGLYVLKNGYATEDLGMSISEYQKAKQELIKADLILFDEESSVLFIKRYLRYHFVWGPYHQKALEKQFGLLPKNNLMLVFLSTVKNDPVIMNRGQNRNFIKYLEDEVRGIFEKDSQLAEISERSETEPVSIQDGPAEGPPESEGSGILSHRMIDAWNSICGEAGLPKIRESTKQRLLRAARRLKERPLQDWIQIFQKIAKTPFLLGENDRGWKADFEWIIRNEENGLRVLEGKYDQIFADFASQPKKKKNAPAFGRCEHCGKETPLAEIEKYGSCSKCFKPLDPGKVGELLGGFKMKGINGKQKLDGKTDN